jgi:hypothetical protein
MSYTLIDPPVTPFHPPEQIEAWLTRLRDMPESPERDQSIEQAERWLTFARELADAR